MKKMSLLFCTTLLAGCGNAVTPAVPEVTLPPLNGGDTQGVVVRARALFTVEMGDNSSPAANFLTTATQPVAVVQAPSAEMTLDNTQFAAPSPTPAMLDFGQLTLSSLQDNNLRICGATGKLKCTQAQIRIYTTGVAGAGIYNSVDGYGAPLLANLSSATPAPVGLNAGGAIVLQTLAIPANKNVLRLSDFSPAPVFDIAADFTNAGAGTYETTIVVEYVLL